MNSIEKEDYFQFLEKWFTSGIDISISSPTLLEEKIIQPTVKPKLGQAE